MDSWLWDESLRYQGINGRKTLQREHQPDPSDQSPKTICPVWVPFEFRLKDINEPLHFHVKFDVINGGLPLLIGPSSLNVMGATLNFKFNTLPLDINQIVYGLDLFHQASHPRLPLLSKGSYTRTLNTKQGGSHFTISSPLNKRKQYSV